MYGSVSNRPLLTFRWIMYATFLAAALVGPFLLKGDSSSVFRGIWAAGGYVVFLILQAITQLPETGRLTFARIGLAVGESALAVMFVSVFGGTGGAFVALLPMVAVLVALEHGWQMGVASSVVLAVYLVVDRGGIDPGTLSSLLCLAAAPALSATLSQARILQREGGYAQDQDKLDRAYQIARREAGKRQEHEEELYQERRRFESLVEVAHGLAQIREQEHLLQKVVECATDQLNARGGAVFLLREGRLVCQGQVGLTTPTVNSMEGCLQASLLEELTALGYPLAFDTLERDPDPATAALIARFERLTNPQAKRSPAELRIDQMVIAPLASAHDGKAFGILAVVNQNLDKPFTSRESKYLQVLCTNAAVALKNILFTVELERSHWELIQALAQAIEAKDSYTSNHVGRVRDLSVEIARAIGLERPVIKVIAIAATLHDVGKISTPDSVLLKPGPLTDDEYEIMKQHADNGATILRGILSLPEGVEGMVRHHHEHWDGRGYPLGLKGKDIPLGAQIISIADCYDAMTYDRPYRKGFPPQEALKRMEKGCGTQFNPKLLCAFFALQGYVPRTNPVAAETYEKILGKLNLGSRLGQLGSSRGIPSHSTGAAGAGTEQNAKPLLLERN